MVAILESSSSPRETWILHGTSLRDVEEYIYERAWRYFVEDESLRETLRNNPLARRDIGVEWDSGVAQASSHYRTEDVGLWIGVSGFRSGDTVTFEVFGVLTVGDQASMRRRLNMVFNRTDEFGKTRVVIN